MYPLAGDDLEAVFLEILGAVLFRGLVEFDTVVHHHTRDQCLLTPADKGSSTQHTDQTVSINVGISTSPCHYIV